MRVSPLNKRRWRNFQRNKRAYWSLWIFGILFILSLFAEFIANDKPILVSYRGELRSPLFSFYSEQSFGGDFLTEANYGDPEVECLIVTGGLVDCFDTPDELVAAVDAGETVDIEGFDAGWTLWPIIPYSFNTIVDDVLARVIYGFRLSVAFAFIVTLFASIIGIAAGAVQGFFAGWTDLIFQRIIEIWTGTPSLYVIIIIFAILGRSFWLLVFLSILFGWPALVGVVRAEFLRARNLEYVRAAKALGISNTKIMFRHMLPNAMVATLTLLPFIDLAGQTKHPSPMARVHRFLCLRDHAVLAGLHL